MSTTYKYPVDDTTETSLELDNLADVTILNPVLDDVLHYDPISRKWINKQIEVQVNVGSLGDLDDVTITAAQNDEVLTFDFASGIWRNKPVSGGSLASLSDVDTTGAQEGDSLVLQGTTWVPGPGGGFERGTLDPANFVLDKRTFFDNLTIATPQTFTLQAGSADGVIAIGNLVSDGASVLTWGPEFVRWDNQQAELPTVLPLGDNTVVFAYDGTQNRVLVDIRTQVLTADGSNPMTGDLDLGLNNVVNVNRLEAEFTIRKPFTAPTSGSWTPDFSERSDFSHGVLVGALTINNPTNQALHQEGVISFDNTGGFAVTLGANFAIMNGQDPTIPAARVLLPYKVFAPGVIFYSIETG